jgi:hypothetical protein
VQRADDFGLLFPLELSGVPPFFDLDVLEFTVLVSSTLSFDCAGCEEVGVTPIAAQILFHLVPVYTVFKMLQASQMVS